MKKKCVHNMKLLKINLKSNSVSGIQKKTFTLPDFFLYENF